MALSPRALAIVIFCWALIATLSLLPACIRDVVPKAPALIAITLAMVARVLAVVLLTVIRIAHALAVVLTRMSLEAPALTAITLAMEARVLAVVL